MSATSGRTLRGYRLDEYVWKNERPRPGVVRCFRFPIICILRIFAVRKIRRKAQDRYDRHR